MDRIEVIIKQISRLSDTGVSEISLTSSFKKIGFDIIDMVELIMVLEDKFEFRADDCMYDAKTVNELYNKLKKHIN